MTLADIQQESLRVLEEFHSFCTGNGLAYSLAYGTLIGAIRHKGFIPWDDDIDVIMPRPDYEKLLNLYTNSNDFILLYPKKGVCSLGYARLCDISRTDVTSKSPWFTGKTGVWIDIFPIDAIPEDYDTATKKYLRCHKMYRTLLAKRRAQRYIESDSILTRLHGYMSLLIGNRNPTGYATEFDKYCKEIPYGSTSRVMDFASPIGTKVFTYAVEDMNEYIDLEFCGKTFRGAKNYDTMLRAQYGDYMQLPPAEQQVQGHSVHTYRWKHQDR